MWSSPRDNWERLVAAVLKKDEIWQLCHQDSITTVSSNTHRPSNSNSSGEILSISSSRSRRISLSSPRQTLHTSASDYEATNNTFGIPKLFSALLLLGRRKPKGCDLGQENNFGLSIFSLRELRVATDNFSNKNVLGHGGNSTVYKCRLGDGSLVVVKRLTRELIEMGKELEIASIAAHHNVIHARGFCITEKERLLVYRYMVNGSVASCLRG